MVMADPSDLGHGKKKQQATQALFCGCSVAGPAALPHLWQADVPSPIGASYFLMTRKLMQTALTAALANQGSRNIQSLQFR